MKRIPDTLPCRLPEPLLPKTPDLFPRLALLGVLLVVPACTTTVTEKGTDYEIADAQSSSFRDTELDNLKAEVEKYPKRHDLHYRIAGIYFERGSYYKSRDALEQAIELESGEGKYHFQLGRVYLRMQELEPAETQLRTAIRCWPPKRFSGPHAALGYVLSLKKDHEGALREFQTCIEIEPGNTEYYYSLAAQYDLVGNKEQAIHYFREYLQRGGTTYRRNAIFILESMGVKVEDLPPPPDKPPVVRGADRAFEVVPASAAAGS